MQNYSRGKFIKIDAYVQKNLEFNRVDVNILTWNEFSNLFLKHVDPLVLIESQME